MDDSGRKSEPTAKRGGRPALSVVRGARQPPPVHGPRAQRTIEAILAAAKEVFLQKGFGGTRMDDIADAAHVSRASVYTYFPTKRDVLFAIGADSNRHRVAAWKRLAELPGTWALDDLVSWVKLYFEFLDNYGAFTLMWGQAAFGDEEMKRTGLRALLKSQKAAGDALDALRGWSLGDPTQQGLIAYSMLQGTWYEWKLRGAPFREHDIVENTALAFEALLRAPRRT
jgi:TetR/AcrR family transcriptional regulator